MNERIDVLAVMNAAASRIEASGAPRYAARVSSARDAMAELIEAHKELMAGYESRCGDWENADFNACYRRAAAALARVGGASV